jgi:hypothetical protein
MDKHDVKDVRFKDGYPDFSEISKGDVRIDDFSTDRTKNFAQADMKFAEQKNMAPEDVSSWRKENRHTWHECEDMRTMQLVPSEVHGNIAHSGGVSRAKAGGLE